MVNQITTFEVTSSVSRYRVSVRGIGVIYDGYSKLEANAEFKIFATRSKTKESRLEGCAVFLFQDFIRANLTPQSVHFAQEAIPVELELEFFPNGYESVISLRSTILFLL
jgi:hypothetical protein